VQSLDDLGYTVNLAGADQFTVSPSLRLNGEVAGAGVRLQDDIARGPIYKVDERGGIVGTVHP
jgi:hypothetical protein